LLSLKLQQNPALRLTSAVEVQHAAALGWRLDVNRATAADWLRLPGITADQVNLLLRLQRGGVQLSGAEDLGQALDLQADQVAGWLPLLDFRWYSEPPSTGAQGARLDLNLATTHALGGLGLSSERCQRLVRERAREPFRDLADLQERLQLPSDLVERWIGKVRFGATQAGPALPLSSKKPRHS
jgi:DNA uptake protein ComE-like DNA-binding protein